MTIPIEGWPEESAQRLEKLEALRRQGVNPYPNRFRRTHTLGEIASAYRETSGEELEKQGLEVKVSGRVLTKRTMGKASFATMSDSGDTLQLFVRQNDVGDEAYRMLVDLVDRGDFVGATGRVMRTKTGELSVQAKEIVFLSKALLPPPEKWHGLSDVEVRYRQRYVDLIANPEVRRTFVARSRMVGAIRRFLDDRGYYEVETPMMQQIPGGALARPFTTHHNALDVDLYLRIAPELYLKRLVVGGLERVYEINRNFRNEGISSMHNPEFTMLEFYTAYFDCRDVMAITEEILAAAAKAVGGDGPFLYKDREVSFTLPFRRLSMKDAIAHVLAEVAGFAPGLLDDAAKLDAFVKTAAFAEACAKESVSAAEYLKLSHGKRIAQLFEDFGEEGLWEPTFIIDYPVEISPLAKTHAENPQVADRFELYMAGMEVANGFSELNDPLEQRERFLDQLRQREGGDAEAHLMDEDYIRALGHGLPPTGGCGVGIDRLAMVLTSSPSIRDVILFPQMRPETGR